MASYGDYHFLLSTNSATLIATPLNVPNILMILRTLTFALLFHRGKISKTPSENFV